MRGSAYYGWVVHGLEFHAALMTRTAAEVDRGLPDRVVDALARRSRRPEPVGLDAGGGARPRARSRARADNQDQRDAIAAAVTARQHTAGTTQTLIDILVPAPRT